MNEPFAPIGRLVDDLAQGRTSAAALTERALFAIADPAGDGSRTFTRVYDAQARAVAAASDGVRSAGVPPGPLAGLPLSIKDLFDVSGETTRAGSRSRDHAPVATADAAIVARLRSAGAVLIGRTTMSEFAYSGLGLNPHDGTPRCVWDRAHDDGRGRAPGGSSSGAAISVAEGMAVAAIGTDTGGSVRIPAAFNGLVGFKPTARRVPTTGCFPLSTTLDSIGPLATTVDCCARIDAVLSGEPAVALVERPLHGLRIASLQSIVVDELDEAVARDVERAVGRLASAGVTIVPLRFPALEEAVLRSKGIFSAAEAWRTHRAALEISDRGYDPRVAARIRSGASVSAADYLDARAARLRLIATFEAAFEGYDAWIAPTVGRVPPPLARLLTDDARFNETNLAVLRNPSIVNALDGCAVTLPVHRHGEAPVGLMLFGPALYDRTLLSIAAAVELTMTSMREA